MNLYSVQQINHVYYAQTHVQQPPYMKILLFDNSYDFQACAQLHLSINVQLHYQLKHNSHLQIHMKTNANSEWRNKSSD